MQAEKNRAWIEVSLESLSHNYLALREQLAPSCRFMGVVKSNAYGHGALPVARRLQALGADYLGVASLAEGIELREGGITVPILVLGVTPAAGAALLLRHGLTQTVTDGEMARGLSAAAQEAGGTLRVHVKVDTGMGRLGVFCDEETLEAAAAEILALCRLPGLIPEGIFTHFAAADEDEAFTLLQFCRFVDLLDRLEGEGLRFPLRHSANSAATLRYPFTHLDMVRPGLALYGYHPGPDMEPLCDLLPAMELKSRLVSVRSLPRGTSIGYGRTATLDEPRRIAVVSIGYGDGYRRIFSNRHSVGIGGKRAPILGRVCMDMCMADVTELPEAAVGEEVTLYSREKGSPQSLKAAARRAGTIPYELLCALGRRLPRLYDEGGTTDAPST